MSETRPEHMAEQGPTDATEAMAVRGEILAALMRSGHAGDAGQIRATVMPTINAALDRSDYRLALLRAVVSFVDANDADLPLTLLESIRIETSGAEAEDGVFGDPVIHHLLTNGGPSRPA